MDFNILEQKLSKYYDRFLNPTYTIGDWIVVDDKAYNQLKNKLNIVSILSYTRLASESIIVIETKKEYYAIKYSGRFICIRKSETEYGLLCDTYDLLAINKVNVDEPSPKIVSFPIKIGRAHV